MQNKTENIGNISKNIRRNYKGEKNIKEKEDISRQCCCSIVEG